MDAAVELQKYGVGSSNIRTFTGPATPELLDYLDLVKPAEQQTLLPDGVAENQGRALLFFVDESRLALPPNEQEISSRPCEAASPAGVSVLISPAYCPVNSK
jgi:hypothetical protein